VKRLLRDLVLAIIIYAVIIYAFIDVMKEKDRQKKLELDKKDEVLDNRAAVKDTFESLHKNTFYEERRGNKDG